MQQSCVRAAFVKGQGHQVQDAQEQQQYRTRSGQRASLPNAPPFTNGEHFPLAKKYERSRAAEEESYFSGEAKLSKLGSSPGEDRPLRATDIGLYGCPNTFLLRCGLFKQLPPFRNKTSKFTDQRVAKRKSVVKRHPPRYGTLMHSTLRTKDRDHNDNLH